MGLALDDSILMDLIKTKVYNGMWQVRQIPVIAEVKISRIDYELALGITRCA